MILCFLYICTHSQSLLRIPTLSLAIYSTLVLNSHFSHREHAMKNNRGKTNVVMNKEDTAENWCFVCKDGGDLRICDYKKCLKSYHPHCVNRDDSFLESEEYWACAWHSCCNCDRYSYFHCYTCTNAVCRRCCPGEDFLKVKGQYGFCNLCLKLAMLIEENKEYDSDGEKVDFTDRETVEGLFMEYYEIIKEAEGFGLKDIYNAQSQVKVKKKRRSGYVSEEFDEVEEQVSEDDDSEPEKKRKRSRKENRSRKQESASQTPVKSNKKEFIGWASRSLIEFLTSIGKSTSEELSQHDVAAIVNEYIKENKLFNPEKRRIITCDARLQSLFKRKTISRYRINDALEDHFAENHEESEDDELGNDSEENADTSNPWKRQRRHDAEKKTQKKDVKPIASQSCFASIAAENIKLVYLKRSLLRELLKQPKSFEEKVVGCFIRVKSHPNDCCSRSSHQLRQIKGVRIGESTGDTALLCSEMPGEVSVHLVSEYDFTEDECEDLGQKVLSGQIERPTIAYLEEKVKMLHEDMTKHWIAKELSLLQNLIDRANEKGWRRELFEYLERKKRLQNPLEQTKLLENVPKVIPDVTELGSDSGSDEEDVKSAEGSPMSTSQCNSDVHGDGCPNNKRTSGNLPAIKTDVIELLSDDESEG